MAQAFYPFHMYRAQLQIILRNGDNLQVGFEDDEAVNAVLERLKRAVGDPAGVFFMDMTNTQVIPPTTVNHYIPSREIIRFAVIQHPRVASAV